MRRDRRRAITLAAAILAIAAPIGTGIALGASHAAHHARTRAHHRLAARAFAAAAQRYQVLSRARTGSDEQDAAVVGAAQQDPQLEPDAARVLETGAYGRTWLIPTADGRLCLGVEPGSRYEQLEAERGLEHLTLGYACATTSDADSEGIVVRVYDEVVGVVPDGVTSVTTRVGAGTAESRDVSNNTYRFSVPDGFQDGSVSFLDGEHEEVDRF